MNALRSTLRPVLRAALPKAQRRQMGGGAAPEWTGIDKIVRDRFPEDYQGRWWLPKMFALYVDFVPLV